MISCISFSIFFMSRFLSFFLAGELLLSVCLSSQLEFAFLNGLSPDGLTESRSSLLPSRPRLCTLPVMMDACRVRAQSHSAEPAAERDGPHGNKSGTNNNREAPLFSLIKIKPRQKTKKHQLAIKAISRPQKPGARSIADFLYHLHPHTNMELHLRRKHLLNF